MRAIRDWVSRQQFEGWPITMWESSGWFRRRFVVRGPVRVVDELERLLRAEAARRGIPVSDLNDPAH